MEVENTLIVECRFLALDESQFPRFAFINRSMTHKLSSQHNLGVHSCDNTSSELSIEVHENRYDYGEEDDVHEDDRTKMMMIAKMMGTTRRLKAFLKEMKWTIKKCTLLTPATQLSSCSGTIIKFAVIGRHFQGVYQARRPLTYLSLLIAVRFP